MSEATTFCLIVSAVLFGIGTLGVLPRRSAITILMSIEIMLNAGNLALIAVSRVLPGQGGLGLVDGHVFVLFVLAIAAAEAAVGLAIVLALYRLKRSTDIEVLRLLRW
ncbi:MAG: NADH-quinone oxidoreductase subunit NuoK [Acidobacteriota bacterium]|nr:MAG: NADH-quinone oxidoreductase subunit NuoK [Acidobacteriota bacterium]